MRKVVVLALSFLFALNSLAFSGTKDLCEGGSFIDFFLDIRWEGIFPIKIAGVKIRGSRNNPDNPPGEDKGGSIICVCKKKGVPHIGIMVSYWNPVRVVETTKIPWCIPTFGIHLDFGDYWKNVGTVSSQSDMGYTFTNAHLLKFNVLDILNLFLDVPCVPHEGLDIAYFSELDPSWNNSLVAYFLNPEALLFANPAARLACVADSASATATNWGIDQLFWCAGAWGNIYPFTGHSENSVYVRGNVLNMARLLYREARLAVSWDTALDECGAVITPIWIKSHHKFHQLRPVRGPILTIGQPTILWSSAKNPPGGTDKGSADNFSWLIFKLVNCCFTF